MPGWKFCGGVSHTNAAYLLFPQVNSHMSCAGDFERHWKFCGGVSHTNAAYLFFLK
jgi:hypothetical protein